METALTPMDFARRARKLYGDREAVVASFRETSPWKTAKELAT